MNSHAITIEEFKGIYKKKKAPKYKNVKVEYDGIKFDSTKEKDRYVELKNQELAGLIRKMEYHKVFKIEINGYQVCNYEADFCYERFTKDSTGLWCRVVEDVKGYVDTKNPMYQLFNLKKKLMFAVLGIEVNVILTGKVKSRKAKRY